MLVNGVIPTVAYPDKSQPRAHIFKSLLITTKGTVIEFANGSDVLSRVNRFIFIPT